MTTASARRRSLDPRENSPESPSTPELSDKHFVVLARKVGYPTEEQLKRCRAVQVERAQKGEKASLFAWAKAQGFLTPRQASRFERWADQIARQADEPLEEEESGEEQAERPRKKKRIHESAAHFAVEAEAPEPKKKRKKISQSIMDGAKLVAAKIKRKRPEAAPSGGSSAPLVAFCAAVAGALIVVAVVVATKKDDQVANGDPTPAPKVVAPRVEPSRIDAKPRVDEPTKPRVDAPAKPAFDAAAAVAEAERVEQEEREAEALSLLELSYARAKEPADRDLIACAKLKMLARFADKLRAEASQAPGLAADGDEKAERERVARLRKRFPRSLEKEFAAIDKSIDDAVAQRTAREETERLAREAAAKLREAVERYATVRATIDKALAALDTTKAKSALGDAPTSTEPVVADQKKLDERRIAAIAQLVVFAGDGYRSDLGSRVELEMRSGPTMKGKLLRIEGDRLAMEAMGGEIAVAMADLAPRPFLFTARRGARKKVDDYAFARGVLLAALGDRKAAIDALEASTIPEAEQLAKELKEKAAPAVAKKPEKTEPAQPKTEEPKPAEPVASTDDDERIAKALQTRLKVRPTVQAGEASYDYNFTTDDQLLDWKNDGFDVVQVGTHEILARTNQNGLLIGASSRGAGVLTHCLRMKGDLEIEVRMMFNQMSPSGQFVVFFGEKNGKSIGASFGQQLVKIGASGVKPLAGNEPDRARWASERLCTFRIVKKGDQVEITMNGIKCAAGKLAKGEGEGKIGILGLGIRAIVESVKVKGVVDPAQL
jgi:hypothetical protein